MTSHVRTKGASIDVAKWLFCDDCFGILLFCVYLCTGCSFFNICYSARFHTRTGNELILLSTKGGWKPGYMTLECQFQFRCVKTQMSGFSFGLVFRLLKIGSSFGFSFAYTQLRFLGFSFGFIQESSFILNRNYSNALLFGVFVLLQR